MRQTDRDEIFNRLSQKGLINGKIPTDNEITSPWYIKSVVAVSAWLGAIFLSIFVAGFFNLIFNINSKYTSIPLIVSGIVFIYIAYKSFQKKETSFLEHFMLAISMVGQVMITVGLFMIFEDIGILIIVAIFQAFLMWYMPNYIHTTISSFFMIIVISYFFYDIGEPTIPSIFLIFIVSWLWINEFNFKDRQKIEAIAYGQTTALFLLKYSYFGIDTHLNSLWFEIASILTLLYVIWSILKESQIEYDKTIILLIALLAFISFEVTGLIFGVLFLLIGFAHSNRFLLGLGVISSLSFLSYYYYYLGDTLMDKAKILALMGIVILLGRWIMNILLKRRESHE